MVRGGTKGKSWLGVWKELDAPTREQIAAVAFEQPNVGKALSLAIARHARVRRQSVERWSPEKQAREAARIRRLPSASLAAALLTHFHLAKRARLVLSFLDFLKIPHQGGLIRDIESIEVPPRSRMVAAIRRVAVTFPRAHADLFFDVISCQSGFDVFSEFDAARAEAFPSDGLPKRSMLVVDTFGGQLDAGLTEEQATPRETAPPAPPDDTPPTFTTLDQVLMRSIVASVADVHGSDRKSVV